MSYAERFQASSATQRPPTLSGMSRFTFFRQSGWMVAATTVSGAMMYAVHKAAGQMPKAEYGVFTTLLQVLSALALPSVGLQFAFAQQTVSALQGGSRSELARALRSVMLWSFLLWLVLVCVAMTFQNSLLANYKIANPMALWVTLALALASLWSPIITGVLQGQQNFLWLGWASMLNGLTRLAAVTGIVLFLSGYATGALLGVLMGMIVAIGVGGWQIRDLFQQPAASFAWKSWLWRAVALTFGFGAVTFMLSVDMIVVQRFFPKEETGFYGAAGMIGRALYFFTAPMTAVLFPKIVHSAARAEKSTVLAQALGATALLGIGAAAVCTALPELPLRIVYDASFLKVAPLVPLFAWCMLPLTLTGVLVNNLLARGRFGVVWWLIAVATSYNFTLRHVAQIQPQKFENVVWTLGAFGLIALVGCLFFTWWENQRPLAPR